MAKNVKYPELKNISKEYRPIPFWSWNEKLCIEETKEQITLMDKAGMGGFFMHARGGLESPYMGEEWFDNGSAAIEESRERGMQPWAYDENGWPSGFGNGEVNGLGIAYQQKYLRMESEKEHEETAICRSGVHYFYYDINPFYVDVLDKEVTKKFIQCSYEPYYEKYGNKIEGFFTDEPQISRNGIPWSFVFEKEYQQRYGENILEVLEELFLEIGNYKETRVKFWKMVTDLFSQSFMKQIYDWCDTRNLMWTGHMVCEDFLGAQVTTNGVCMPHYEYMHIPGMDFLGRNIGCDITPLQVSSVAEQLGKKAVLSETFALCGHNVSFAELKGIYEWQMVHGINLLCQHLEGYSIRGIRKRDYPPAMYIQQPWWEEYHRFNDAMSRIGSVLCQGSRKVDVLVLEPQTTVWSLYDAGENKGVGELHDTLVTTIKELQEKHIEFHLGDETILERHGKVENGKLIVGTQSYSKILLPGCEILFDHTKELLETFTRTGGKIVSVCDLCENPVIDAKEITYTSRSYDGFKVHYFVNTSPETLKARVLVKGKKLNIYTGKLEELREIHEFEPWGSLMVFEDEQTVLLKEDEETIVRLDGRARIVSGSLNSLTLDKCDYYFDGVLQEKDGYVLNITERANSLGRSVHILQEYHAEVAYIPKKLYLAIETPEKFEIVVNGHTVTQVPEGYFRDKSIRKIDITPFIELGVNTIAISCDFKQRDTFYKDLEKAQKFESEKNKLVYDMEIEAVYLLGDFSVRTDGEWTELDKNAVRYHGSFVIDQPKTNLSLKNFEQQGYPFFCGSLQLECEIQAEGNNPVLQVDMKGINVLKVEINGIEKVILTDKKISLKEFDAQGKTKVKLTVLNNLRNLMGPHHLEVGESYQVTPACFFKEKCIWNLAGGPKSWGYQTWNEDYCFVEVSV